MKTILITGAGSGIGAAAAHSLAEEGNNRLILVGRNEDKLNEVLVKLPHSENHAVLAADVRNASAFREGLKNILGDGSLDCVFANAGIGGENAYGVEDRWDEIVSVNLTGTYITIMECLPYLRKSSATFKHILLTSSILARFGVPNHSAYIASKTAILGLTRAWAVEWAREQILVNAITPGWVETQMSKDSIQRHADRSESTYESAYQEQMNYVPTGRMSQPEELGNFVAFLFSGKQNSITGQALDINNGAYMQ
jgi:NAD(P)-dependent dehydrogenase (short-subunit alcohol dehydrogenase family)